jgi:hypothetical protein
LWLLATNKYLGDSPRNTKNQPRVNVPPFLERTGPSFSNTQMARFMQLYQVGMMMPFCPQTQQDDALLFTFSNAFYILRNISKNYTASRLDKQSMFVFFF